MANIYIVNRVDFGPKYTRKRKACEYILLRTTCPQFDQNGKANLHSRTSHERANTSMRQGDRNPIYLFPLHWSMFPCNHDASFKSSSTWFTSTCFAAFSPSHLLIPRRTCSAPCCRAKSSITSTHAARRSRHGHRCGHGSASGGTRTPRPLPTMKSNTVEVPCLRKTM